LTDPIYSHRLKELLEHIPSPQLKDIQFLRVGRHFRVPGSGKIIVGRHEEDNKMIDSLAGVGDYLLWVEGQGSPLTVASGTMTEDELGIAAALCARYSDAKTLPVVDVSVKNNGDCFIMQVCPASDEIINNYMIRLSDTKGA
jgi:predicted ribosome quality control (RQC) complex YloA/Tae2 family protein